MIYLGSERVITSTYANHITAEDFSGEHLSDVSINSTCRVIKVINKFISHEDSINYNNFLNNQYNWFNGEYYNCISITGKFVKMSSEELGGNQIFLETIYNNKKYIIRLCHLNDILVNVGDIITPNQVIAHQGNTGLVLSSKNTSDITYGSHVHIEVTDESNNFINPREFATGNYQGTIINQSNEINNSVDQIKILVDKINIRENASIESKDIGDVYINETYSVLDIIDSELYTWYKIKTNTNISGYIASSKKENWVQFIQKRIEKNIENYELIFNCIKDDYYYLKLYEGETLYIKKAS